jgi:hypothetical protein
LETPQRDNAVRLLSSKALLGGMKLTGTESVVPWMARRPFLTRAALPATEFPAISRGA